MASINNENISINDRVYDLIQGVGIVVDTSFQQIVVRFSNGARIAYNNKGYYGGVRRLYWHNPIVVEPPKDNRLWNTLISCIQSVYNHLFS